MPLWLLDILQRQLPRLRAEQLMDDILAAAVPHMKGRDRRNVLWRVEQAMRPRVSRPVVMVERHDPESARKWFEARGVHVARNHPHESQ